MINLLPWRELRDQHRIRSLLGAIIGSLLLAILVWGFWQMFYWSALQQDQQKLNALRLNLRTLEPAYQSALGRKREEEQKSAQIQFVQKQNKNYRTAITIFNEISAKIPKQVYLIEISRRSDTLSIAGRAESHADIAAFLRQMDIIMQPAQPAVSETKTHDSFPAEIDFHLTYDITQLY